MLADPTQKLLQELPQARNLRDLCLILAHYTRALPFSRVAFDLDVQHSLLPVDENGELLGVELGWSPEFIRRWVESGYNLACPLVTPCKLRRWPFTWGLDEENLGVDPKWLERPFTAIGQQTISVLKEVGVRSGIIVPVHQPGGRTGFVSWISEEPLAEMRRWVRPYESDLFVAGHAFLNRVEEMVEAQGRRLVDDCPLTERERECLAWVACGKTDSEIGIIIDRSPETARFHVRNAIAKLGASSRSHAVAKAIKKGWIDIIE